MYIVLHPAVHRVRQASVEDHVGVAQLGSLGAAGRAASVEDDGRVVGVRRHGVEGRRLAVHQLAQRLRALDGRRAGRVGGDHKEVLAGVNLLEALIAELAHRQVGRTLEAEVGFGVGVLQVIGDLSPLQQHVERHDDRPGLQDAVVHDGEVGQVGATEGHLVARLDAQPDQPVGDLVGGGVDGRVGQLHVVEDDCRAAGRFPRAVLE